MTHYATIPVKSRGIVEMKKIIAISILVIVGLFIWYSGSYNIINNIAVQGISNINSNTDNGIKSWTGSGSKTINYKVTNAPVVVTIKYRPKSDLVTRFDARIEEEVMPGITKMLNGNVITNNGDYLIIVDGDGYDWEIIVSGEGNE